MAKNQKMTDKSAKDLLDLMGKDMRDFFVNMPKVEEKPSKFVVDKKGRLVLKKEDGGAVKKMAGGGAVCRGMGAAMRGGSFKGTF